MPGPQLEGVMVPEPAQENPLGQLEHGSDPVAEYVPAGHDPETKGHKPAVKVMREAGVQEEPAVMLVAGRVKVQEGPVLE